MVFVATILEDGASRRTCDCAIQIPIGVLKGRGGDEVRAGSLWLMLGDDLALELAAMAAQAGRPASGSLRASDQFSSHHLSFTKDVLARGGKTQRRNALKA